MKPKQHRIPPQQLERARQLRRDMTFPERLLWGRLRAAQLGGVKFRRQHEVGPYIADYYCPAARLVIELDGESHSGREMYDSARTDYLNGEGYRVVRYTNDEVLGDLEAVVEDIARQVGLSARDYANPTEECDPAREIRRLEGDALDSPPTPPFQGAE